MSDIIGTGHVYRCLNLAYQYKEHNISFICKNHNYNLNSKISENYKVYEIVLNNYNNVNFDTLFTSRGYSSGFDWRALTEKQLLEWGVKYHELILKKPYADYYYIDNKAIHVFDCL